MNSAQSDHQNTKIIRKLQLAYLDHLSKLEYRGAKLDLAQLMEMRVLINDKIQ